MPDDPAVAAARLPAERNNSSPSFPAARPDRSARHSKVVALVRSLRGFFPMGDTEDGDSALSLRENGSDKVHKNLIDNIRDIRDLKAEDVMVPRADIVALPITATHEDLLSLYIDRPHTRLPIYQDTLDDIVGFVHIKDAMTALAQGRQVTVKDLIRDVMIISPSLPVLDLLVDMQQSKRQLAVVVDEYGGIDGLIGMNNIIEAIVGEIRDEHIHTKTPRLVERTDGTILADARVYIEDFEDRYGEILSEEEREEIDTLGGLVMSLAGHLPVRGETLAHASGWSFEIIDADPRRVKRMRILRPSTELNGASDT